MEILEFSTDDGGTVLVETQQFGPVPASPGDIASKALVSFEKSLQSILGGARALREAARSLSSDQTTIEFGIKFSAKAGAIISSIDSSATFKVSMTWNKP